MREAVAMFIDSKENSAEHEHHLDAITRSRIILAVDEALANVIEHGYADENLLRDAQIFLTMRSNSDYIEFELRDNGSAFNPLEHRSNTEFYYEEGLEDGIGLIALTTLDTHYERKGLENVLTLKRKWEKNNEKTRN